MCIPVPVLYQLRSVPSVSGGRLCHWICCLPEITVKSSYADSGIHCFTSETDGPHYGDPSPGVYVDIVGSGNGMVGPAYSWGSAVFSDRKNPESKTELHPSAVSGFCTVVISKIY